MKLTMFICIFLCVQSYACRPRTVGAQKSLLIHKEDSNNIIMIKAQLIPLKSSFVGRPRIEYIISVFGASIVNYLFEREKPIEDLIKGITVHSCNKNNEECHNSPPIHTVTIADFDRKLKNAVDERLSRKGVPPKNFNWQKRAILNSIMRKFIKLAHSDKSHHISKTKELDKLFAPYTHEIFQALNIQINPSFGGRIAKDVFKINIVDIPCESETLTTASDQWLASKIICFNSSDKPIQECKLAIKHELTDSTWKLEVKEESESKTDTEHPTFTKRVMNLEGKFSNQNLQSRIEYLMKKHCGVIIPQQSLSHTIIANQIFTHKNILEDVTCRMATKKSNEKFSKNDPGYKSHLKIVYIYCETEENFKNNQLDSFCDFRADFERMKANLSRKDYYPGKRFSTPSLNKIDKEFTLTDDKWEKSLLEKFNQYCPEMMRN